jgi:hypothetical protein
MKKTFTKDFIRDNSGCYDRTKTAALDFMQVPGATVSAQEILESSISTKDKYWFFAKKVFTKEQNQHLTIGVASIVLEVYEKKYPNDDRPRKAIKAAEDYLADKITIEELRSARAAAAAAASYAAAAAAADAAASYAAAAAAAAADAAAYAAAAAAADAAAYAAAYAAATLPEALLQYLILFCETNL